MYRSIAFAFLLTSVASATLVPIPAEQTREVLITCSNSGTDTNSCPLGDAIGNTDGLGKMRILGVTVEHQLSTVACTKTNFLSDAEKIVTRKGCGAVFRVKYSRLVGLGAVRRFRLSLLCESHGGEPRECPLEEVLPPGIANTRIESVSLQHEVTPGACDSPKKWSFDAKRVRVEAGCRAIFDVGYQTFGDRSLFVETESPR